MSRLSAQRPAAGVEQQPFVVLPENQLAFASARQLLQSRHPRTPPLVTIYGPPGVGKTHLTAQVLGELRSGGGPARIAEVTALEFATEWAEAGRSRNLGAMHEMYCALDALLCEDLQGFRGRFGAQEAFITVVDELLAREGRVLVTAGAAPAELRGLSSRLVSRCHGGVCVGIGLPGRGSRLKLLRHFASQQQVPVALEALEALASEEGSSPRGLRGVVRRLTQAAAQQQCPADLALLRRLRQQDPGQRCNTVADVAREVARQFGIALRELRSHSRVAPASVPRQAAMYLSRELTDTPCSGIGRYFDGRTHSSVVYACERYARQLAKDSRLAALTNSIRAALASPGVRIGRKRADRLRRNQRACG